MVIQKCKDCESETATDLDYLENYCGYCASTRFVIIAENEDEAEEFHGELFMYKYKLLS